MVVFEGFKRHPSFGNAKRNSQEGRFCSPMVHQLILAFAIQIGQSTVKICLTAKVSFCGCTVAVSTCEFAKKKRAASRTFCLAKPKWGWGFTIFASWLNLFCLIGEWIVVRGVGKEAEPNSP